MQWDMKYRIYIIHVYDRNGWIVGSLSALILIYVGIQRLLVYFRFWRKCREIGAIALSYPTIVIDDSS